MKTILLSLLFGSVLLLRADDPASGTKIFLDSDTDWDKSDKATVTEWYITSQQLEKLPAFHPDSDDPPFSLKAALAAAQIELKKHLTPKMTWSLDSVELHQIDEGNSGETAREGYMDKLTGKWFYKVIFSTERPDPKTTIWTAPYPVYVLMDGTTATRRERPQTKDEADSSRQMAQGLKNAVLKDAKKSP